MVSPLHMVLTRYPYLVWYVTLLCASHQLYLLQPYRLLWSHRYHSLTLSITWLTAALVYNFLRSIRGRVADGLGGVRLARVERSQGQPTPTHLDMRPRQDTCTDACMEGYSIRNKRHCAPCKAKPG